MSPPEQKMGSTLELRQRIDPSISHPRGVGEVQDRPARTFLQFTSLPRELRDLIWEYALLIPRVVEVHASFMVFCTVSFFDDHQEWNDVGHTYFGKFYSNLPPLLHACHESRELAITVYELCMSNLSDCQLNFQGLPIIIDHPGDQSGIWLQPDRDTLHLPYPPVNTHRIWHEADIGDIKMNNVKNIAVDVENTASDEPFDGAMEHSNHIFAKRVNGEQSATLQNFFMVFEDGSDEDILLEEVQDMDQQGNCDLFEEMDPVMYRFPQCLAITLRRYMAPENSQRLLETALGSYVLESPGDILYVPSQPADKR